MSGATIVLLWILAVIIVAAIAIVAFWKLYFLRLPARTVPKVGIVSPASGRVVRIIRFRKGKPIDVPKGLLGRAKTITADVAKDGTIVVIMLTPMDVHFQRAPADGIVRGVAYQKGKFNNAVFGAGDLHAFENEQNAILLQTKQGTMKVVQVAGVLARRIECYVRKGQKVKKGEVIGLINLGSQVMLILPKQGIKVKVGQKVTDGETIIA
jgi:phosphatidylserine decarboxylase